MLSVWLEPRNVEGAPALARGRVRSPASGHEQAVKSTRELGAFVDREIDDLSSGPWIWEDGSASPAKTDVER